MGYVKTAAFYVRETIEGVRVGSGWGLVFAPRWLESGFVIADAGLAFASRLLESAARSSNGYDPSEDDN